MERALKERMIGAAVLVAFAVLIVPVFLDGPADDAETVSQSVTLPGQNDQPRRQQTIVLPRDRDEPVPTPAAEPAGGPPVAEERSGGDETVDQAAENGELSVEDEPESVEPQAVAQESPVADEPADDPPAPTTTPTAEAQAPADEASLFAVQLGSFSSRGNAERLAADLRNAGFAAFLSRVATGGGELHRVRVGPQKDRAAATEVASRLAAAGHNGQVVSHP